MFTKCPECRIAFRVTAKVLQQAGGNVRCGHCNNTFSALAFLSEEMPETPVSETTEANDDKLAETSRRLLQTLDDLAGPEEVRIEDTGVEWRVLDEEDGNGKAEPVLTEAPADEVRYDDNTPLPDDFGGETEDSYVPPALAPQRRTADFAPLSDEFEHRQGDLALSEPEDWTDLLDEVRDPQADSLEVEEELAAIHTQLSAREEQPPRESAPVDLDTQFETQAEAMGLDLTGSENALTDEVPLLSDPDIEPGNGVAEEPEADTEEAITAEAEASEFEDQEVEKEPGDEAAEIDVAAAGDDIDIDDSDHDDAEDFDELSAEQESDIRELITGRESTGVFEAQIKVAARALAGAEEEEGLGAEVADIEFDEPEADEEASVEKPTEQPHEDEPGEDAELALEDEDALAQDSEHVVPPPTDEEISVDMEIDQELMSAATQDDDFTATLVGLKDPEQLFDENADDVETIIMEGEFVSGEVEKERLEAENAAKSQLDDPGALADTYAMNRNKLRGGRRKFDPPGYGVIAAVVLLALLLAAQFIHNSRESLATFGLFNQTIAPVYRVMGQPVTPEWNIRGWQFEATNGSVDELETTLTIVSRLANRSEQPLPYPLVHVSLTDRWEDIMGSRILEPGEYLAGDLDSSKPVRPGDTFSAVITIEQPSAEATGFKLNVCYRVGPGRVRCAIEDFKN